MAPPTVLVVDDEGRSFAALRDVLARDFAVIGARDAAEAEARLRGEAVQVILCDQNLPGACGIAFLRRVRTLWPGPVRMIIAGTDDAEGTVACVGEAGIHESISRPWHPERLLRSVRAAAELFQIQSIPATALTARRASGPLPCLLPARGQAGPLLSGFGRIVHEPSSPVAAVLGLARRAAEYDISVLITGASGTGKELLARAIHDASARAGRAFVVENCGALPDELLESELFGCKKGAFTGAHQDRIGLFEVADGGTIFLDEIGETSPSFQVKLLRVLQEGEIRPLGAQRPRRVNVRVVSATNRDLMAEVEAGRFRRDLYYRLAAFPIHLPPLRDRPMDIPAIAERILGEVNRAFHRRVAGFAPQTLELLARHAWPGNVRELHNEIQRMVALSEDDAPLPAHLLSPAILADRCAGGDRPCAPAARTLKDRVEELERRVIAEAMERLGGNVSHVAGELGLSRVGLRSKIERHGLRRGAGATDA
ncbi:sigma-54-dependent transcriptional regulator [Rhodovastum atsumiense]|uniref:sigma-54-dependent transcriptional regulator n=1 Tax=Rhodovastum atsumiense TaxID=504468 RepID=UPI0030B888E7